MTITEHLEISVLTAPVAAFDRRALSQAWYSALYGDRGMAQPAAEAAKQQKPEARAHTSCAKSADDKPAPPIKKHVPAASAAAKSFRGRGGETERRAPRSELARKIERTFLHPRCASRNAAFALDGEHGRVQVLLRSQGSRLKVVAVCAPRARTQVARALEQARYTLALRGIAVEAEMREQAAC